MPYILSYFFAGAAALYTLSATTHYLYMFRREFDFLARWSTRLAWLVQSVGFIMLLLQTGRLPFYTLFEFTYLLTWFMVTVYTIIEFIQKNQAAGSFLMPVVAIVQIAAVALPKPSPEQLMLNQFPISLIAWHIGVSMMGYGFLLASAVSAALYLIQERNLRRKTWGPLFYRIPPLEVLDTWSWRFVFIGFPLLTIGIFAGALFAQSAWSQFWMGDPKVVFSVFAWMIYGLWLLARQFMGMAGRRAAWWALISSLVLLVNYFVMNMLSSLHRFTG